MSPIVESDAKYINAARASQIIGCSPTAVQRAALLGQIRVKLEPGIPARYHQADVERVAATRRPSVPRPRRRPTAGA